MKFKLDYKKEKSVYVETLNKTILEISLANGIPHMHACGGNARCSTCRVLVVDGEENLCPRNEKESVLAKMKGFKSNIRLACQTKVKGSAMIRRLVLDEEDAFLALNKNNNHSGTEQELVIMFCDIRNFTPFAEANYDYDVVHILNRYYYRIGEAIAKNNGEISNYMGDGIMVLFGGKTEDVAESCKNAIFTAFAMLEELEKFNHYLQDNFAHQFGLGVGIHTGRVIAGKIGHPDSLTDTAIGNIVNMTSRIESENKNCCSSILLSQEVYNLTKMFIKKSKKHVTNLKGITGEITLYEPKILLEKVIEKSLQEKITLSLKELIGKTKAPGYLRLAWHDAIMFSASTGKGGADGSIRFEDNIKRESNKSLEGYLKSLEIIKEKYPEVSWADIIAFAGAVAVEVTNGPHIPMKMGRRDKEFEASLSDPPEENLSPAELLQYFTRSGFTAREMIALTGGHTLGKANNKPFTADLFEFNNSFYKTLLEKENHPMFGFLKTDKGLLSSEETKTIVAEYAQDQEAFFRDFIKAYQKLTSLGQKI